MSLCFLCVSLLISGLLTAPAARGQVIRGVVIAGLNATQVDGDEVYGYHKFGANVGAAAILPYNEKWSLSIETLYNQKGSYEKSAYSDSASLYKLNLNYLEVPVLIHFTDKQRLTAGLGFSWGRLVGVREWEHGKKIETTTLKDGPYGRNDWDVLVDLRFRLYRQLHLDFRYAYSMAKIRTRTYYPTGYSSWDRKQYNNMLSLRLMYIINESTKKVRKEE